MGLPLLSLFFLKQHYQLCITITLRHSLIDIIPLISVTQTVNHFEPEKCCNFR